jgi:hypothetical protein
MGYRLWAAFIILGIAAILLTPSIQGAWGVYSQPGYDEGRSITAANESVYVGGLSLGSFDGYRLLKYNLSGDLAWEKQFPVPERRMTKNGYRDIAVGAMANAVSVAFSNGTFVIKSFHANGTLLWENRWRRPCRVTDLAIGDNETTIVVGCTDGGTEPQFHVVAFDAQGDVAWNTSGRGRIYGIDIYEDVVFIAGERDGVGLLSSLNHTGGIAATRFVTAGPIRDIVATSNGIVLLHSETNNVSITTVPSMEGGNETRHYYGKTAEGKALLAAQGRVFLTGNVYNRSSNSRDFLLVEYLYNGTFTDVVRYNGDGTGEDVAWDAAELDDIVATGAIYTQQIIPPNQVIINREIYTTLYTPRNLPPTASFTWQPENPQANDRISFNGTAMDPDGFIAQWQWDFDDGSTASQQDATHVYKDKGVYQVTLTVQDDDGARYTATQEVVVAEEEQTPGFSVALLCLAVILALALYRRLTFK